MAPTFASKNPFNLLHEDEGCDMLAVDNIDSNDINGDGIEAVDSKRIQRNSPQQWSFMKISDEENEEIHENVTSFYGFYPL